MSTEDVLLELDFHLSGQADLAVLSRKGYVFHPVPANALGTPYRELPSRGPPLPFTLDRPLHGYVFPSTYPPSAPPSPPGSRSVSPPPAPPPETSASSIGAGAPAPAPSAVPAPAVPTAPALGATSTAPVPVAASTAVPLPSIPTLAAAPEAASLLSASAPSSTSAVTLTPPEPSPAVVTFAPSAAAASAAVPTAVPPRATAPVATPSAADAMGSDSAASSSRYSLAPSVPTVGGAAIAAAAISAAAPVTASCARPAAPLATPAPTAFPSRTISGRPLSAAGYDRFVPTPRPDASTVRDPATAQQYTLDIELYVNELQAQFSGVRRQQDAQIASLSASNDARLAHAASSDASLRDQNLQLQDRLAVNHLEVASLQASYDESVAVQAQTAQRNNDLVMQQVTLEAHLESSQRQYEHYRKHCERLNEELATAIQQRNDASAASRRLASEANPSADARSLTSATPIADPDLVRVLTADIERLQRQLLELQRMHSEVQTLLDASDSANAALSQTLQSTQQELTIMTDERDAATARYTASRHRSRSRSTSPSRVTTSNVPAPPPPVLHRYPPSLLVSSASVPAVPAAPSVASLASRPPPFRNESRGGHDDREDDLLSVVTDVLDLRPEALAYMNFFEMPIDEKLDYVVSRGSTKRDVARQLLQSKEDRTGTRWRRRSLMVYKTVRQWAVNTTLHHPHRGASDAMKAIANFKFPPSLRDRDADKQAYSWNSTRGPLMNAFRDCLTTGCDMDQLLRKLLAATQNLNSGNIRVSGYVKSMLDDNLFEIFAPLAADVLIFELDDSYRSGAYGSDSVTSDWDACKVRHEDDDSISLAQRIVAAYLQQLNSNEYDTDTIWRSTSHATNINERYSQCLLNDLADRQRGAANAALFRVRWNEISAKIEINEASPHELSCIRIAHLSIRPAEAQAAAERSADPSARSADSAARQRRPGRNVAAAASRADPPADADAAAVAPPPQTNSRAPAPPPVTRQSQPSAANTSAVNRAANRGSYQSVNPGQQPPPPVGHRQEPPPAGHANNSYATPPPTSVRRCAPPANGQGKPNGLPAGEWTAQEWDRTMVDFMLLDTLAPTAAGVAAAKVRPADASMRGCRVGRPSSFDGNRWHEDACAYCFYRPRAPASTPPGHPDHWKYGTGQGDHNPYRCQPQKRFIAEGGDEAHADFAAHIRQCLRVPPPRNNAPSQ